MVQGDEDNVNPEAVDPAAETGLRAPDDLDHVGEVSPWDANLADTLFMNKLLLWNQPHLLGRHAFTPEESPEWVWPYHAGVDPEG